MRSIMRIDRMLNGLAVLLCIGGAVLLWKLSVPMHASGQSGAAAGQREELAGTSTRKTARESHREYAKSHEMQIAELEKLAETHSALALLLVEQVAGTERKAMLNAMVRGWGLTDPDGAARWVLTQPEWTRQEAYLAMMEGLVENPEEARRIAQWFIDQDAERAEFYGSGMLRALVTGMQYESAGEFAAQTESPYREDWIRNVYESWGSSRPAAAANHAGAIADETLRQQALGRVMRQWARDQPAEAADFAMGLPGSEARGRALTETMETWVNDDSLAARDWLLEQELSPDLDGAAVTIATHPDVIRDDPGLALDWIRTIGDAERRSSALTAVLLSWAAQDPAAARAYTEGETGLNERMREMVMGVIRHYENRNGEG